MPVTAASWSDGVLAVAWAYGAAGALVAVVFLAVGIDRVMPAARGAYAFRPLLLPGLVMLWPVVLWRWFRLNGEA
ncbi:hypothetical protein [uncultured Alsobacter sp.]|uniref:hypothetical protein n=1 Tax=uncultured Alsobacter sp. TaxID=1748258 RepID=UPI0025E5C016|nr:hypothetical protein [uncultured Alsobacter sp.]